VKNPAPEKGGPDAPLARPPGRPEGGVPGRELPKYGLPVADWRLRGAAPEVRRSAF
jgi:hypothetical protein